MKEIFYNFYIVSGGFTSPQPATETQQEILNQVKDKAEVLFGTSFNQFVLQRYSSQVVAGMNYLFEVMVDGDELRYLKVYVPLPFRNEPPKLMENMSESEIKARFEAS
mmetsp:Transcript_38097/g.38783  ORF Transcript_38097/g.38783 Transcript_38097/m.38783 type:complete len:108 (-) Transcript_38097:288-611(-)